MKKLVILFVMLIGFFSLTVIKAQTSSGTILIGVSSGFKVAGEFSAIGLGSDLMSMGFSSVKTKSNAPGFTEPEPDKTTSLNLMPKLGVFVVNNLAVGLDVIVAYNQVSYGASDDKTKITLLMGGPFVRYYIPGGKVLPFLEGNATFGSSNLKDEYTGGSNTSKYALSSFGGGLGIAVPIGEKVTFDVMAGYTSLTVKAKENNPNDERSVMGSFGIRLGFDLLLGSK